MYNVDQPENEKLVVNKRDELIQEIMVLRDKRLQIEEEARLKRQAIEDEDTRARKKEVYEASFRKLVKIYLKLHPNDLGILSRDKLMELERLVYELAQRRWKKQRILMPFIWVIPFFWINLCEMYDLKSAEFPTKKILLLREWYEKSFGSIADAVLNKKNN